MENKIKLPMIDVQKTGDNINRLRKEKDLPVLKIANICGFENATAVYKWINGKCLPKVDHLVILAHLFGVTVDELLCTYDVEVTL